MWRFIRGVCLATLLTAGITGQVDAQKALTWDEVKTRFEANNPTLRAGQIGVDESKANEITAYLRPNPNLALLADQIDPFPGGPSHGPFAFLLPSATTTYLHERRHKRELRQESAQKATNIATDSQSDLKRTLLFNLRSAFVQALQGKAVLELAKENLTYYDKVLDVNRERFKVGDIAQVDLDRLELQRIQFLSDLQTAEVNLRTAKIQLLALLNERTPVEQFDVAGSYDFVTDLSPLDDYRRDALETRPDLKAAIQAIDKADTDHRLAIANGSTDPTFGFDVGRNPPIDQYIGVSVNIPLRIFDRNQGEKLRTQLDIERQQRLADAARAQVFSDVDSAYATVNSTVILLKPYKQTYLQQAARVRETISFSYEHGGASLLDFLDAQKEYRDTELNYLNLIGSYLIAASQLNLAVGREVLQ
jgi:outer membrane protein, heavy metal efflux system